jgi:hypothetical protein
VFRLQSIVSSVFCVRRCCCSLLWQEAPGSSPGLCSTEDMLNKYKPVVANKKFKIWTLSSLLARGTGTVFKVKRRVPFLLARTVSVENQVFKLFQPFDSTIPS